MKTQFDLSKVDFRTTAIENMFLDTYLEQAPGDALRIYLYGWKLCYEAGGETSPEDFAAALSLSREELVEGLRYWIDSGLVLLVREEEGMKLVFRSLILLWAGVYETGLSLAADELFNSPSNRLRVSFQKEAAEEKAGSIFDQLFEDLPIPTSGQPDRGGQAPLPTGEGQGEQAKFLADAEARKRLFDGMDAFLSEGLSYEVRLKPAEIRQIHDLLDNYPISADFFLYAYQKASSISEASSRSFVYLLTIVENWLRFEQITDKDSLDAYLDKEEKARKEKKTSGRRSRKKAESVTKDNRMTKEERQAWVREKLEASKRRSLRGVKEDDK